MESSGVPPQAEEIERRYICIARTSTPKSNGSILRNIRSCESIYVRDRCFPLGTVVWEHYDSKSSTKQWWYWVNAPPYTFRFKPFAFAYFDGSREKSVQEFKAGDTFWNDDIGKIGVLYNGSNLGYFYLTPRELIDPRYSSMFPEDVNWFVSDCQSDEDSVPYNPRDHLNDYKSLIPKLDRFEPKVEPSVCLCSHRTDYLAFFAGVAEVEKMKKKRLRIRKGEWYYAYFNPGWNVTKLCSIRPIRDPPVATWVSADKEIVMLRDYVRIPKLKKDLVRGGDCYVSRHPLLYRIHFPRSCRFFQTNAVEVCFCRQTYRLGEVNHWVAVAINRGFGMAWLDEIPPQIARYLNKKDFPFIKSQDAVEAAQFRKLYPNASFDQYMSNHANIFMKGSDWIESEGVDGRHSWEEKNAEEDELIENIYISENFEEEL